MFKTIHECRVELISYTVMNVPTEEITMLGGTHGGRPRLMKDAEAQNAQYLPCSAARASFGNEDKTGDNPAADRKLMGYLAEHEHMTPFEYQHATFLIECPLFIRSQIHRHRTFSYNEISRRYTSDDIEFWVPDKFRGQSKNNKQASSSDTIATLSMGGELFGADPLVAMKGEATRAVNLYDLLLANGVAREIARAVLPQSLITRFYMGGNLRNWAHFINLRTDSHAQEEVRVVAERIADQLRKLWPESCNALGI